MKKTVVGVLSLALLAGAVPLAASDTGNDEAQNTRGPGKGNRMAHLQEQLGLSDEQVEQIRSIRQSGGSRDDVRAALTEEQRVMMDEHRSTRQGRRGKGRGPGNGYGPGPGNGPGPANEPHVEAVEDQG